MVNNNFIKTMIESLDGLANKYKTDKGSEFPGPNRHGYASIYDDKYLKKWRDKDIRMLEIGVCLEHTVGGQSINMWLEYFQKATIYTFDIVDMRDHPSISNNNRVKFYRGDQSKREDFDQMYKEFGSQPFDFILEDGSHIHEHQMISLVKLFPYVKSGGYYILEDMSIPNHPVCCIRNDETYVKIQELKENKELNINFISSEEIEYLKNHIKSIEIYHDIQDAYAVAIITKV